MPRKDYPRWLWTFIEVTSVGFWLYFTLSVLFATAAGWWHTTRNHFRR